MINTTWNWDQTAASNMSALKCICCPRLSLAWPMFLTDHSKSHALVNFEYVMRYAVYWPSSSCSEIASRRGNWIKNTFYWFKLIRRVRKYMLNKHTYHHIYIYTYIAITVLCKQYRANACNMLVHNHFPIRSAIEWIATKAAKADIWSGQKHAPFVYSRFGNRRFPRCRQLQWWLLLNNNQTRQTHIDDDDTEDDLHNHAMSGGALATHLRRRHAERGAATSLHCNIEVCLFPTPPPLSHLIHSTLRVDDDSGQLHKHPSSRNANAVLV